jgi:hypothetical protein
METAAAAGPSQLPPNALKPPPIPKKRRIRNTGITVLEGNINTGQQSDINLLRIFTEWAKSHPDTEVPNHEQRKILLARIHVNCILPILGRMIEIFFCFIRLSLVVRTLEASMVSSP